MSIVMRGLITSLFLVFAIHSTSAYAVVNQENEPQSSTSSSASAQSDGNSLLLEAEEQEAEALEEPAVTEKQLKVPGKLSHCIWVQTEKWVPGQDEVTISWEELAKRAGFYFSDQEYRCLSNGMYQAAVPSRTRTLRLSYDPNKPTPLDEDNARDLAMAITATQKIKLPLPTPGMAIRHNDAGTPYVYVNSRVWFWTDPKTYKPVTARAQAGGTWVEATATPVGLGFNPRKGDPYFECSGPGDVYDFNKNQIDDRAPSGCYYIYKRITHNRTPVEARLNIRWAITWRSNTAQGTLPDMYSTSTPQHYEIGELHNLVVG